MLTPQLTIQIYYTSYDPSRPIFSVEIIFKIPTNEPFRVWLDHRWKFCWSRSVESNALELYSSKNKPGLQNRSISAEIATATSQHN